MERPDQTNTLKTSLWVGQTPGRKRGEVTEDRGLTIGHRDKLERRVTEKSSSFWAGELQGGQYGEIHRPGQGQRVQGGDRERWNQARLLRRRLLGKERKKGKREHPPPGSEDWVDGKDHWSICSGRTGDTAVLLTRVEKP